MLKHLTAAQQLDPDLISTLFESADDMRYVKTKRDKKPLDGKILAALFYEPSTRTRLSFEAAMLNLGGRVISTEAAGMFSSAVKGESLEDTIRVVSGLADVIVLRHPEAGAAEKAAYVSKVPIINGGDGKGQHPTQALLDMYTIFREIGKLDNLNIAMVGDLANGRTVHSLAYLLGRYKENKLHFVSPKHLSMKEDIKDYLTRHDTEFSEREDLNEILPEMDVVYMTRLQKERMDSSRYEEAKGKYTINEDNLKLMREGSILMHPLPHVEEINLPIEIEQNDKRVAYFRQARNGLYIRMALLNYILPYSE